MGCRIIFFDHHSDERRREGAIEHAGTTRRERVVPKGYFALDRQVCLVSGMKGRQSLWQPKYFFIAEKFGHDTWACRPHFYLYIWLCPTMRMQA